MAQLASWIAAPPASISVGRVVELTVEGALLVDFPENPTGRPVKARFVSLGSVAEASSLKGLPVLMVFEEADLSLPIVLGPIFDHVQDLRSVTAAKPAPAATAVVEAKDEVVLRCGESSLSLKKDGKIVLKGSTIVSRASRANKIKGGTVAIN